MIQVVNGFVCNDCSDEALAKRGVDPSERSKLGIGAIEGGIAVAAAHQTTENKKTGEAARPSPVTPGSAQYLSVYA